MDRRSNSRAGRPRPALARGTAQALPPQPTLPPGLVLLGEFGRPHGLAGEIRVKSYTGEPKAIAGYGPLIGQDGRSYVISHARQAAGDQPDLLVVRVDGVTDRNAAEALNRRRLYVPRDRLGVTEEDEYFLADLVGLRVEGPVDLEGKVVAVPDYGGGEMLEIAVAGRRGTALLPFLKALVPVVDIAGGRVVIDPPPGWLDEEADERA